ncbi:hypothetical protein [Cupriavidus metallidurans]|uniref:hypothetical protein n=1 Tax=Cupriavidus metallidurans TaxID=119219 RepID=UPI001CCA44CC|nr:hypothetical protein [Cupriavidus metallidurans]UBM12822.1 hypothetical protein LAI70_28115 [Cupriavidus metallidurans]
MNRLLEWIKAARWRKSLSHCMVAPLIQLPVGLAAGSAWLGALAVVVWFWSREQCEFEFSLKRQGESTVDYWNRGWFPWQWGRDSALDLLAPAASSLLIAALFSLISASVQG